MLRFSRSTVNPFTFYIYYFDFYISKRFLEQKKATQTDSF